MADLKTEHLSILSDFLYGGMNYYPPQKIAKLVKNLKIDEEKVIEELNKK